MKVSTDRKISRSLSEAHVAFKHTADSWATIQQITGLPDAFYGVGKTLPIFPKFLKFLESSIKKIEETKEVNEKFAAIVQFVELSQQQVEYFDAIFDAVTTTESQIPKEKRYRIAAEKRGGEPVEAILKDLLQRATDLATQLSADEELKFSLQAAYDEVAKLKPSLEESVKGPVSINNYGDGTQFYHGGEGHQNHCAGGSQYNGNGCTFHVGPSAKV